MELSLNLQLIFTVKLTWNLFIYLLFLYLQPNFLIPIFPRPAIEGNPISQSINKLLDTTGKVVNNFADMFKTTLEILAG